MVAALAARGYTINVLVREPSKVAKFSWCGDVNVFEGTLGQPGSIATERHDALLHLAWEGLPHYKELFHIERNLPQSYQFVRQQVLAGTPKVLVLGTCLEYGMAEGALSACRLTDPQNAYALAKDTLHKQLRELAKHNPFDLQWARLFYLHGEGQNPRSFLPLLASALERGDRVFNMSGGEQLRDYLPVEGAATQIVDGLEKRGSGVFNVCSGEPISLRRLAEEFIARRGSKIELNFGHYPYPDFEPMSFWGTK